MDPMTAMFLISTGMSMYSGLQAGRQQADAMREQALLDEFRANELLERAKINARLDRQDYSDFEAFTLINDAAKGLDLSNSSNAALERANIMLSEKLIRDQREANIEAMMMRRGAEMSRKGAKETERAAFLGAASQGLQAGYTVQKYGRTESKG